MKCASSSNEFIKLICDPLKALKFFRKLARIWTIWPLDPKTNRIRKVYHEFYLWFIIMNLFITILTLCKSVCNYYKFFYPILMVKNISTLMIASDSCLHLVFYRIHRSDLRILLDKVFDFMNTCKRHEKLIMKKHYERFLGHYTILVILYVSAALLFFIGTFILKNKFPIDEQYPFSTDSLAIFIIVFTHQVFSIIQNSVVIIIDLLVISLFWYAGARFKILKCRLRVVENDEMLKECIIEHQEIVRFVQYTVATVRFIIYKTITVVAIILLTAGIQLLYYDATTVVSQFTLIIIVSAFRIITYASTIDEMKNLNESLQWTIYKSDWLKSSPKTKRNISIFVHRCQMPLVTMNGLMLNIMSLNFFSKFMYTILSHLTTLRAIIEHSR